MANLDAVVFELGTRSYAIRLSFVREVVRFGPITPVPLAPLSIVGAMNAQGQVVPVIDLCFLLGQPEMVPRAGESGLLVELGDQQAVMALGRIHEVVRLHSAQPMPRDSRADGGGSTARLTRVLVTEQGTLHLVDVNEVFKLVAHDVGQVVHELSPLIGPGSREVSR